MCLDLGLGVFGFVPLFHSHIAATTIVAATHYSVAIELRHCF
jgi:hypothetical protein